MYIQSTSAPFPGPGWAFENPFMLARDGLSSPTAQELTRQRGWCGKTKIVEGRLSCQSQPPVVVGRNRRGVTGVVPALAGGGAAAASTPKVAVNGGG